MQDDDQNPLPEIPSKSSRKREMTARQALGERLTACPPALITRCELPETLAEALHEYARLPKRHGAQRRQLQYIGKLMRDLDDEALERIRTVLERQEPLSRRSR